MTSVVASAHGERMDAWRRQIGHRHRLAAERGPRPFAIIGYRVRRWAADDRRVAPCDLTIVALFDEITGDELVTRLVGVGIGVDDAGLSIGGPRRSRFDKNLRLAPAPDGRGARLDAADGDLFDFALGLERHLQRCCRSPYMPRRRVPTLPMLDAGGAANGPLLVDLSLLPKRQVVRFDSPDRDLVGRVGTTSFDFVNTRFRVAR